MMDKSRSWKRGEKHKAEDTVHEVEETRCIKHENYGSQGGRSAGRGRERRCQDSLGVRTPPTNVVHRGGGRKGGLLVAGREMVTFPGEAVMGFRRSGRRLL